MLLDHSIWCARMPVYIIYIYWCFYLYWYLHILHIYYLNIVLMFKCIYYQVILADFHIFDFYFYKSKIFCIFILVTCYDQSGKDIEVWGFYASLNIYEYICIYLKNTKITGSIGFASATNYIVRLSDIHINDCINLCNSPGCHQWRNHV